MTTPIDTMHLWVLLDAVDATEHAYHMCDPVYDERRPAAWHAMDEAQRAFREAWASTSPRALLDEVERLRALFATPDALHQVACAACGAVELADCICSECCDICGHTDAVCMCDRRERCVDCGYAQVECACADEPEEGGDHG